jgi:hypothetical protein
MGLMAQESYSDEQLDVLEIDCGGCDSKIICHVIPMRPLSLYLENHDEMIKDMNRDLDYFYCGVCSRKCYTSSKVVKIFTMRKI